MDKAVVFENIHAAVSTCPVFNAHCHHLSDSQYAGVNLDFILSNSYAGWMSPPPARDIKSIQEYLRANGCNSYFRWLFAGLKVLYGLEVTADNFSEIDRRLKEANRDATYHLEVLKNACGYERILLDKYDDPGSDNEHPEVFTPVYRINRFLFGYSKQAKDHNGNSPYSLSGFETVQTLDDYLEAMRKDVLQAKKRGAVALKNAVAYDRDLVFHKATKEQAGRAFNNPDATAAEIRDFQDFVVFELARTAQEAELPVQIHTGMGRLEGTRPIGLINLITEFPEVRFDFFHAGFPWTGDALAMLHNYPNTFVNIVWLPLLSTREAKEFIIKALEVASAKRICWGCDTWTSEESLGALLAVRHALAAALTEMLAEGAIDMEYALYIARRILYDNAKGLYRV